MTAITTPAARLRTNVNPGSTRSEKRASCAESRMCAARDLDGGSGNQILDGGFSFEKP
jgi:hypothetical protein